MVNVIRKREANRQTHSEIPHCNNCSAAPRHLMPPLASQTAATAFGSVHIAWKREHSRPVKRGQQACPTTTSCKTKERKVCLRSCQCWPKMPARGKPQPATRTAADCAACLTVRPRCKRIAWWRVGRWYSCSPASTGTHLLHEWP
jgi:hypothetical protein